MRLETELQLLDKQIEETDRDIAKLSLLAQEVFISISRSILFCMLRISKNMFILQMYYETLKKNLNDNVGFKIYSTLKPHYNIDFRAHRKPIVIAE